MPEMNRTLKGNARDPETITATPEYVRASRLRAQCLHPEAPAGDLVEAVRSLCGVNAQSGPAMLLSLRARVKGLEIADISRAMAEDRSLVRTWAMRGTLHLIDSRDLSWMVSLLGPGFIKKYAGRRNELGLDEKTLARGLREIQVILAGREREPVTRDELTDALISRGVNIERKSQAPYHLIVCAALEGIICIGPDADGTQTYCLTSEWIGKQDRLADDKALEELCIRYLKGYGPADARDFTAWSGLPVAKAKKGWEMARDSGALRAIGVGERELELLESQYLRLEKSALSCPAVNLLPAFDSLVLGYADRELLVPGKYHKEVYHGGQTVPVVLVDGLAAGVWRYERHGKTLSITVRAFERFDREISEGIEKEAAEIGCFFGYSHRLQILSGLTG